MRKRTEEGWDICIVEPLGGVVIFLGLWRISENYKAYDRVNSILLKSMVKKIWQGLSKTCEMYLKVLLSGV